MASLLAAQLPAADADEAAERDTQTAALNARLKRIETGQNCGGHAPPRADPGRSHVHRGFDGQPPRGSDIFGLDVWYWGLSHPHSASTGTVCSRRIMRALAGVLCVPVWKLTVVSGRRGIAEARRAAE